MGDLFKIHAEMCKVFSNSIRLEILNLLKGEELSVTELIGKTGLSQSNISQHLSIMKAKDILLAERKGKNVYYTLSDKRIIVAFNIIKKVLIDRLQKDSAYVSKGATK